MINVDRFEIGVIYMSCSLAILDVDVGQVPWATEDGALHKETAVV